MADTEEAVAAPAAEEAPAASVAASVEKTFALIKPDAVQNGYADEITNLAELFGFTVVAKKKFMLTKQRAEEFYLEHYGKPFFKKLIQFMTSGPCYAMILGKPKAIASWRELMGPTNSTKARKEAPKSLRALYGTDGTMNATHGSDSPSSARREIKFFFPGFLSLPVADAEGCKTYIAKNLQPTLIKALTVLAKEKPSASTYEALTFISRWLLENNPNKPRILTQDDFAREEEEDDEAEFAEYEEPIDLEDPEVNDAATKIQASFRGMQDRKTVKDKKDSMAPAIVELPEGAKEATEEDLPDLNDPEMGVAATKIQASFRGHQTRKEMEAKKPGTGEAEAVAPVAEEEELPDLNDPEMAGAATKIQASFRGHQTRKEMEVKKSGGGEAEAVAPVAEEEELPDLNDPEMAGAATKIQASFRGHQTRKEMGAKKSGTEEAEAVAPAAEEEELPDLNDPEMAGAATKIQASFRGHQTRKEMGAKKSGGGEAEAEAEAAAPAAEEEMPDLNDPELDGAATKIQASFRGHQTRKEMEAKKAGAGEAPIAEGEAAEDAPAATEEAPAAAEEAPAATEEAPAAAEEAPAAE